MDRIEFLLTLLMIPKLGVITARRIIKSISIPTGLGELELALYSLDLKRIPLSPYIMESANKKALNLIDRSNSKGIRMISCLDEDYPARLYDLRDYPLVLHYRGDGSVIKKPRTVAIIGTREPSEYGKKVAHRLGQLLSDQGWVVVSGLALGCDSSAHQGTLTNKLSTIAVMAHGLDKVYPAENKNLAARIIEQQGCLVSEYTIGVPPNRGYFGARDRIQAALSRGIIVVETGIQGGTMITVGAALNLKRPVACMIHDKDVPDAKLEGNNSLISEGKAIKLFTSEDINKFMSLLDKNGNYI